MKYDTAIDERKRRWKGLTTAEQLLYETIRGATTERKITPLIRARLPQRRVAALDIGCGEGRLLYHLAPLFTNVVGIDFSPHRAKQARQLLRRCRNARVLEMDAERLGFRDALFDFVVSVHVFSQRLDREHALVEASRIVCPGGRLLVVVPLVPNRPSLLHRVRDWSRLVLRVGIRHALVWRRVRRRKKNSRPKPDRPPTLEDWKRYAACLAGTEVSVFEGNVMLQWDRPLEGPVARGGVPPLPAQP